MNEKLKYAFTSLALFLSILLLVSCGSDNKPNDPKPEQNISDKENPSKDNEPNDKVDTNGKKPSTHDNSDNKNDINEAKAMEMGNKAKNYIINGQGDKPEADKLRWSRSFLNNVDFQKMYYNYIKDGGAPDDEVWLAKYTTLYAPIPNNWQELFENDIYRDYGVKITKLQYIEKDRYTAYAIVDGKERAYVVVNSRTGYYHGTSDDNVATVVGKVKLHPGSYRDSNIFKVADMEKPIDFYYDIQISNITYSSFDFAVYKIERVYTSKELKYTRNIIFMKNKALFIGDGNKAAFYGNDYTLYFNFPDNYKSYPDVVEINVTGFQTIEGIEFINNGIPGHEFN